MSRYQFTARSLIKHRAIHYRRYSTDFHVIPPIALYDVYASNGLLDTERKVGKVTSSCRDETAFCQVSVSRNSNKDLGIRKIATGNVLSSIGSNRIWPRRIREMQ